MKFPNALEILKDQVGPEWDEISHEIKEDMLSTLRYSEKLLQRNLKGEATPDEWLHVKAQAIAWVSGTKAGVEVMWWRALKVYTKELGKALVLGVVAASGGVL